EYVCDWVNDDLPYRMHNGIALHPFLIGAPHRIRYLDKALKYISSHSRAGRQSAAKAAGWGAIVAPTTPTPILPLSGGGGTPPSWRHHLPRAGRRPLRRAARGLDEGGGLLHDRFRCTIGACQERLDLACGERIDLQLRLVCLGAEFAIP